MTMAIMLSEPSAYEGGDLELRSDDRFVTEQYSLVRGEAIAWPGWKVHRVGSITRGLREVFVVEWWLDEDCAETLDARGPDSLASIRHALEIDPTSAHLHRWLGENRCEMLPCPSDAAKEAEAAYRKATKLAPQDAVAWHALGNFLVGSEGVLGLWQRAEGARCLRKAHELDPTVVGEPPEHLSQLDSILEKLWRMVLVISALAVLVPTLMFLEKKDKAGQKATAANMKKKAKKS